MEKLLAVFFAFAVLLPTQIDAQIKIKKKKGKYGLVKKKTKITDFEYDSIERSFSGDYYLVRKDGHWGAVNKAGEISIPITYEDLTSRFEYLIGQKASKQGVIDTLNKTLLPFEYEDVDHYYKDSIALVEQSGKWFYLENEARSENEFLVFNEPDKLPEFMHCQTCNTEKEKSDYSKKHLLNYVFENVKYPKEAFESRISGMVVISFIVTKSGDVVESKVLREIGGNCGAEALRVVNNMPKWQKPAVNDGEIVNSKFILPVRFSLK